MKKIYFLIMVSAVAGMLCSCANKENQYDQVYGFSEGFAIVRKGCKYGFIDTNGQEVAPCKYDAASYFSEGFADVCKGGKWGLIDKNGNVMFRGSTYEKIVQERKEHRVEEARIRRERRIAEERRAEEERRIAEERKAEEERRIAEERKRKEEERRAEEVANQRELDIMIKLHELQEEYQQQYYVVERLYNIRKNTNVLVNPDIQFQLHEACNKLIRIVNQQVNLSKKLGDAELVREYKKRLQTVRDATDIMQYGQSGRVQLPY